MKISMKEYLDFIATKLEQAEKNGNIEEFVRIAHLAADELVEQARKIDIENRRSK